MSRNLCIRHEEAQSYSFCSPCSAFVEGEDLCSNQGKLEDGGLGQDLSGGIAFPSLVFANSLQASISGNDSDYSHKHLEGACL